MKNMKRLLIFALCLSAVTMSACGKKTTGVPGDPEQNQTEITPTPEVVNVGEIGAVEENGKVKVTMPATVFNGSSKEMADKIKENRGFEAAEAAKDGSVTFTMSKQQHEQWLAELAENMRGDDFGQDYISVKGISINDDFTEAEIRVDKKAFENSQDEVAASALGNNMLIYQSCKGVKKEDLKAVIKFVDESNGEEIASADITANN